MSPDSEGVIGVFSAPDEVAEAVRLARDRHFTDLTVFLPTGDGALLDETAPGETRVPWLSFGGAVAGAAAGLALTVWTSLDYPLVTGGKPIVSLPPFAVIAFELMILGAAAAAFAGFLLLARLPRLRPTSAYRQDYGVDCFALLIRCPPQPAPRQRAERVLHDAGAAEIRVVLHQERGLLGEEVPE